MNDRLAELKKSKKPVCDQTRWWVGDIYITVIEPGDANLIVAYDIAFRVHGTFQMCHLTLGGCVRVSAHTPATCVDARTHNHAACPDARTQSHTHLHWACTHIRTHTHTRIKGTSDHVQIEMDAQNKSKERGSVYALPSFMQKFFSDVEEVKGHRLLPNSNPKLDP